MGILKEFKEFVLKGNIVELAVAVIIGAAFGAIVSSLVEDVITPLLLTPALKAAQVEDLDKLHWGAIKYGKFLAAAIKFVIIAFVLFMLIKGVNSAVRKKRSSTCSTATSIIYRSAVNGNPRPAKKIIFILYLPGHFE